MMCIYNAHAINNSPPQRQEKKGRGYEEEEDEEDGQDGQVGR